ncbi:hypothetical protein STCU_11495 [Strigomonas culicis]|uniref:Uncharacterized protein n=1 Tax=Strigomonas culicis TaxID=28005 RepID=S9TDT7_9TRYP|nr:hypothetical protein STCU_11495 [Strigomonas culicis]|eukprot:EPY16182.1 hypothetical protein STCU_11495 [Strigomonas culicis]
MYRFFPTRLTDRRTAVTLAPGRLWFHNHTSTRGIRYTARSLGPRAAVGAGRTGGGGRRKHHSDSTDGGLPPPSRQRPRGASPFHFSSFPTATSRRASGGGRSRTRAARC